MIRVLNARRPFALAVSGALALLLASACGDDVQGPGDEIPDGPSTEFLPTLIVSNPVTSASALAAGVSLNGSSMGAGAVYASLPPGTFPEGERAIIRTRRTGAESSVLMVKGGFDPIRIAATAGDTIDMRIELGNGGLIEFFSVVPPSTPPVIVRTDPPPKKRDVPLNATMLVVFSEPIDASALTSASTQLLLDGVPVAGTLRFADSEQLALIFSPAESLTPGAEYELLVTQAIRDLDGDALTEALRVDFSTGAALATPSLSGIWGGPIQLDSTSAGAVVSLNETAETVSGYGEFIVSPGGLSFTVTGTHSYPSVSLTLQISGLEDVNYSGTLSGSDTIYGSLNGIGFVDQPLTLYRR
jgi:hypothetical protein